MRPPHGMGSLILREHQPQAGFAGFDVTSAELVSMQFKHTVHFRWTLKLPRHNLPYTSANLWALWLSKWWAEEGKLKDREISSPRMQRGKSWCSAFSTQWDYQKRSKRNTYGLKTTVNVAHLLMHRGDPLSLCASSLPQPGPWVQLCAAITMAGLAWITWSEQVKMGHKKTN